MIYLWMVLDDEILNENLHETFLIWLKKPRPYIAWDTETIVSNLIREQHCLVMSLSDGDITWVIDWRTAPDTLKQPVKELLMSTIPKIVQNAAFDWSVMRNEGIICRNFYDTMLQEKVLYGGETVQIVNREVVPLKYDLNAIAQRHLFITVDKGQQQSFQTTGELTPAQILYAAKDVVILPAIHRLQLMRLNAENLVYAAALENEVVTAFAEMSWRGIKLDRSKWLDNLVWAKPYVDNGLIELNKWLLKEPFKSWAIQNGYLLDDDRFVINWKSHVQRKLIHEHFFPQLPGLGLPVLRKLTHISMFDYVVRLDDWSEVEAALLQADRQWLIDNGMYQTAGTIIFNWGSGDQVLPLVQLIVPKVKNLKEETLAELTHPFFDDYHAYKEKLKLVTTLGADFLRHVDPDGRVRTRFNQVLVTGRVSSSDPNMQNITVAETDPSIPVEAQVGTRYRNAFVPEPGNVMIDSDYSGQELCVMAFLSKDPVWMGVIQSGKDLHSVCAELVFKQKWKKAASPDCRYYKDQQKCKCSKHKIMRSSVKTINFGLIYGMGPSKLARTLKITFKEAQDLINEYFESLPTISRAIKRMSTFGIRNGYIMTLPPFSRRRYFPFWRMNRRHIESHLRDVEYNADLGAIGRQSSNQPIQGTSADIMKVAMVLLQHKKWDAGLDDEVGLIMQVHDQLTLEVLETIQDEWKINLHTCMLEAGNLVITNGMLGADTTVTQMWTK